jgi:hypothetical protein
LALLCFVMLYQLVLVLRLARNAVK